MTLDPRAARLLRMLAASAGGAAETLDARRQALTDLASLAGGLRPADLAVADHRVPGPGGPLTLRRYQRKGSGGSAMLFLHGGGWVAGTLDTHDIVCRKLALASGCQIFALEYRLAPEHRFPSALDDASAALEWIAQSAAALGVDGARLAIGGDSAGATLAAAAAASAGSDGGPPIALQLLICPILDLAGQSPSRRRFAEGYFLSDERFKQDVGDYVPAGLDLHDPRLSPLLAEDLSSAPATLIHAAEYDPFHDEAMAYADRLEAAGVWVRRTTHAGMIHYFYALCGAIPYAEIALAEVGGQLRSALSA